ncbi:3-carboxy-cis,cis-muconate cycloisomerase [Yoonia sp. 2307UL14-13]|uniref:3-carboxy-cis,cis-muconate cycloisomerase n=1 Tax=Yoonia sp. 2307UL14-13 TaxID=3126506 RepID=UPI0030B51B88
MAANARNAGPAYGMIGVFDHPWFGDLFADATTRQIWSTDRQFGHMIAFETALARGLGHIGNVPLDMSQAAVKSLKGFSPDIPALMAGTARDGLPIPALIEQLRDAAGPHAAAIHTGATSQDVLDTALVLSLREVAALTTTRLMTLVQALADLDKRFGKKPLMGRTRMQAALPITVSDRLHQWRAPLENYQMELADKTEQACVVQLGGPVGTRATWGAKADDLAHHVAETLGLTTPTGSWHTQRASLVGFANVMTQITGSLAKMGQDICLMAQQGIDEIALEGGGTSSVMRHKNNPVRAELLVTLGRFNATQISGLHHAMIHEQERSGAAWTLEWMILPQICTATCAALGSALDICRKITHIGSKD